MCGSLADVLAWVIWTGAGGIGVSCGMATLRATKNPANRPPLQVGPVEFRLYGLDDSWRGGRCLDFFEHQVGHPPALVWLAHHEQTEEARGVRVGTLASGQRDQGTAVHLPQEATATVALRACVPLGEMTLPMSRAAQPGEAVANLHAHIREQAHRWAEWPQVTWYVNDTPVTASVWHFAGAWAGFTTTALSEVDLVLIGIGTDPEGLRLVPVGDRSDYGVDLTAPLDKRLPGAATRDRHLTSFPTLNQEQPHPDQRPFVPEED